MHFAVGVGACAEAVMEVKALSAATGVPPLLPFSFGLDVAARLIVNTQMIPNEARERLSIMERLPRARAVLKRCDDDPS